MQAYTLQYNLYSNTAINSFLGEDGVPSDIREAWSPRQIQAVQYFTEIFSKFEHVDGKQ